MVPHAFPAPPTTQHRVVGPQPTSLAVALTGLPLAWSQALYGLQSHSVWLGL